MQAHLQLHHIIFFNISVTSLPIKPIREVFAKQRLVFTWQLSPSAHILHDDVIFRLPILSSFVSKSEELTDQPQIIDLTSVECIGFLYDGWHTVKKPGQIVHCAPFASS